MMAPQQFCVRWNSHQSNLQSAFPKLLTNEHFADVTLACEARSIRCHKVVLSACSAYFESLLVSNPCQHPIVFMKDMRHRDLRALVDFMYRGEVNVSQEELASLLRAAEALQIRGLSGSDQEVAAAPIGSIPTNLPPDISVRNGPVTPSTGQESPPPGSGNGRRPPHKRRRNHGQGGPGSSPSGGDTQRSAQREDDRRGSDDEVEAVDEEAESPRPRTHGEIQVRGDLHEPSGIDEEGKDEYEEDGGVDLDTVKTEHDYGSQALDNSGGAAGENEDDLEEDEEEDGENLRTEGDGRPSDPQSMHYHHMLDAPGPSGYTPQTHTPTQEKMMMGGCSYDLCHPTVVNDVKEPAISIHEHGHRKRSRRSRDSALDELHFIQSEIVPVQAENKIECLKHFVNTYELSSKPGPSDVDLKGNASAASWTNEKSVSVNQQGAVISLPSHSSEDVSRTVPPSWFSFWAEKKEKYDRDFQEDMRDMLEAILRKLPQDAQQSVQPEKKVGGTVHDCLPLRTMVEFKMFNERLCEELNFKQSFVNYLNSIRATSTKQAMVGFFGKCMDDELMCNFTWAGHTRSKSELQSTPIAKCIVDVVRNLRCLNNPPLAECLKYGSEAVRYANQRRNQWRTARGRGQLQFKQPPALHEVELVERPDEVDIEERIEQPGCDQDRYGVFLASSGMPQASILSHPVSSSVSITSHPSVSPYALPPHPSVPVQSYPQSMKRKVQPLTVAPWAMQDSSSYQLGKLTVARTIPSASSVTAHSAKRQHSSGTAPVPHSSATIPQAHQSSIVPSNSSRTNT